MSGSYVPASDFPNARPCHFDRVTANDYGEQLSREVGIGRLADMAEVVQSMGGRLRRVQRTQLALGGPARLASLCVYGPGNFEIRVPDDVGEREQRFLAAHELGHLVLHAPLSPTGQLVAWYHGESEAEREANWFATGFLMPESNVRAAHQELRGVTVDLADHFGVSLERIKNRCRELDLTCP